MTISKELLLSIHAVDAYNQNYNPSGAGADGGYHQPATEGSVEGVLPCLNSG